MRKLGQDEHKIYVIIFFIHQFSYSLDYSGPSENIGF